MSAAQHTPGPWHVNDAKGARYIETSDDDVIAQVFRDGRNCFEADASLIAAAPGLVAELRECRSVLQTVLAETRATTEPKRSILQVRIAAADAAIAKAEGGAK